MATTDADTEAENVRLRARVDELEAEIAALKRDTAAAVARAQETTYWFERWGVDFNSVMSRPQADQLRKAFRGIRAVYRWFVTAKRRVL